MTRQELINNGWQPKNCRVGTLYFNYGTGFFCRLDKDEVIFFSCEDDMHPLGRAKTFPEMEELERKYYKEEIDLLEAKLEYCRKLYQMKYGKL